MKLHISDAELKERVDRGVKAFERLNPKWFEHVDVTRLDTSDNYECVAGQVYGTYVDGMRELYGPNITNEDARLLGEHIGVYVRCMWWWDEWRGHHHVRRLYARLDKIWAHRVNEARAQQPEIV